MFKQTLKKILSKDKRAKLLLLVATKYINPWLRKLGMTLLVHHFYQPIPSEEEVAVYRNSKRPVEALNLDILEQAAFTSDLLSRYAQEYNDPRVLRAFAYSESDSSFGSGSREFYYSLIRRYKPRHIIEIGAGNSSLICLAALQKNYTETGVKTDFISIDPFPPEKICRAAQANHLFVNFKLIQQKLQAVDPEIFTTLTVNDILFVDSSHVYKPGSDVEYEFLKIYPYLSQGVFVHIHDIFTPFDYPVAWNNKQFRFWNEQYYWETFLLFNRKYKVIAGLYGLSHEQKHVFTQYISAYAEDQHSGSFWMLVVG